MQQVQKELYFTLYSNVFKAIWVTELVHFILLVGNAFPKQDKYQIPASSAVKICGGFLYPNLPQVNMHRGASYSIITDIRTVTEFSSLADSLMQIP